LHRATSGEFGGWGVVGIWFFTTRTTALQGTCDTAHCHGAGSIFFIFVLNGISTASELWWKTQKTLLSVTDKLMVHHTQVVKECDQHCILLRFCDHQLYFRGPVGVVCQLEVWHFIGSSQAVTQGSSQVIISDEACFYFSYSKRSTAFTFLNSIWTFVRMRDRYYAHTYMLHWQIFFQNALHLSIQDLICICCQLSCHILICCHGSANFVHIFIVPGPC
jgi:hypothetical protein